MKHLYTIILVVLSAFSVKSFAQTNTGKGSFTDIAFIEGHWKANTAEGRTIEAVWLAPAAGNITGFMRMMNGDKTDLYEILVYEQSDKGLVSLVKHFRPGLLGEEEKDSPNKYVFIEAVKNRAVFESVNGDLRVLYEKRSATQFAIARGNQENGKWVFKDLFVFNKVK